MDLRKLTIVFALGNVLAVASCTTTTQVVPAAMPTLPSAAADNNDVRSMAVPTVIPAPLPSLAPVATTKPAAQKKTTHPTQRPSHQVGSGYDPSNPSYQGADDPGTKAGRAPTSGEIQHQFGCKQGYITEGC